MFRIYYFVALCVLVVTTAFSVSLFSENTPAFTPTIEENRETETSPEEVFETMTPMCKIFFDAHPSFKDQSGTFSPDSRYFAVSNATNSSTIRTCLFDLKTGINLKRFEGKSGLSRIAPVAFSPDSRRLAFFCNDNIVIWDIPDDREICHLEWEEECPYDYTVYSLQFSPTGNELKGAINHTGRIWNTETGSLIKTFDQPLSPPLSTLLCYPDLTYALAEEKETGKKFLLNLSNGVITERTPNFCVIRPDWQSGLVRMSFSADKKIFAMENRDYSQRNAHLFVWDATTGNDICTVPLDYKLTAYTFLRDGHVLVTACDPDPEVKFEPEKSRFVSHANPMRKPVVKTKTRAIIEFWDIDHLLWHKEQANLFPRKIKTRYIKGDDDIRFMTPSPDGKLLYMRSGKKDTEIRFEGSVANGYFFPLEPDDIPETTSVIRLNDKALVKYPPPPGIKK